MVSLYINSINYKVLVFVIISLIFGFQKLPMKDYFSFWEVLLYAPHFAFGMYLMDRKEQLSQFIANHKFWFFISYSILVSAYIIITMTHPENLNDFFHLMNSNTSYSLLGEKPHLFLLKSFYYLLSFGSVLFVFSLIPQGKTWYSEYGRKSMYPYLLHMGLIFTINLYLKVDEMTLVREFLVITLFPPLTLILMAFLSSKIIVAIFRYIVEPTWLNFIFADSRKLDAE